MLPESSVPPPAHHALQGLQLAPPHVPRPPYACAQLHTRGSTEMDAWRTSNADPLDCDAITKQSRGQDAMMLRRKQTLCGIRRMVISVSMAAAAQGPWNWTRASWAPRGLAPTCQGTTPFWSLLPFPQPHAPSSSAPPALMLPLPALPLPSHSLEGVPETLPSFSLMIPQGSTPGGRRAAGARLSPDSCWRDTSCRPGSSCWGCCLDCSTPRCLPLTCR